MKYLLPFALLLFFACKDKPQQAAELTAEDLALPEGFSGFYTRFHLDSAYQMEHIVFPLQGIPDNADEAAINAGDHKWEKETWSLMKPVDYQMSEYERQFIPLTDEMVMERVLHKNGQYGMVRRFAVIGDEWNLIYYAGLNRIAK